MKKIFCIQDTLVNKITYYHLLAFAMTLPFDRLYSELALISLCIHTCIHLKKKNLTGMNWLPVGILSTVYILTVLGTMYTHFHEEAFYEWERQLALLLFPILFRCNGIDLRKYYLGILLAMAISCALALLYLYLTAFTVVVQLRLPVSAIFSTVFINHNFSAPIDMHATYFSMYITVSAVSVAYYLSGSSSRTDKLICYFMLLLFAAGLIQLSSRAVLIAVAFIANILFPLYVFSKQVRVRAFLVSLTVSFAVFFIVLQADSLKDRFTTGLKDDLTKNSFEPRIERWSVAWELIRASPVYGYGSGSEVALLKESYFRNKLYNSYLNDLNVHNQYLSIAIKTGFAGLLLFLLMLLYGFRIALRDRNALFLGFLIVSCTVSFSENILDANKGIFFFALFFTLFCMTAKKRSFENKIVAI